jgi:hypothetical protein
VRRNPTNWAPETRFTVDSAAAADAARFTLHDSVAFWRDFGTRFNTRSLEAAPGGRPPADTSASAVERLRELAADVLAATPLDDAEAVAYWAYHTGRTTFFLGTSAAGALAHHAVATLTAGAAGGGAEGRRTPLQNLAANGASEISNRLAEGVAMYRQVCGGLFCFNVSKSQLSQLKLKPPSQKKTLPPQPHTNAHTEKKGPGAHQGRQVQAAVGHDDAGAPPAVAGVRAAPLAAVPGRGDGDAQPPNGGADGADGELVYQLFEVPRLLPRQHLPLPDRRLAVLVVRVLFLSLLL